MMGKDVDQRAFELLRIRVAELGLGQFLHMVVQEPRVIEGGLQDQRLAQRDRGAMAAMQRASRKLRAGGDVSFLAEGRFGRKAARPGAPPRRFLSSKRLPPKFCRRAASFRVVSRREHLPKPFRKSCR